MAVYLVTWNLNKERGGYDVARQTFIKHLERYDNVKDHGLESVRWISTTGTASQLEADLRSKLDSNDRIFVTKLVRENHQGWLSQATWDWINARM